MILEIQLTLHQEGREFVGVGAIEGVWFVHFHLCRGSVTVGLAGFSQVMDGLGKCKDRIDVVIGDRW